MTKYSILALLLFETISTDLKASQPSNQEMQKLSQVLNGLADIANVKVNEQRIKGPTADKINSIVKPVFSACDFSKNRSEKIEKIGRPDMDCYKAINSALTQLHKDGLAGVRLPTDIGWLSRREASYGHRHASSSSQSSKSFA